MALECDTRVCLPYATGAALVVALPAAQLRSFRDITHVSLLSFAAVVGPVKSLPPPHTRHCPCHTHVTAPATSRVTAPVTHTSLPLPHTHHRPPHAHARSCLRCHSGAR